VTAATAISLRRQHSIYQKRHGDMGGGNHLALPQHNSVFVAIQYRLQQDVWRARAAGANAPAYTRMNGVTGREQQVINLYCARWPSADFPHTTLRRGVRLNNAAQTSGDLAATTASRRTGCKIRMNGTVCGE